MERLILGIDEAGRGPVIGPMVICGILLRETDIPELLRIGVKDSKLLSAKKREKMKFLIEKIAQKWELIKIFPPQIDQYGITYPQLKGIALLINEFSPDLAVVDAPTRWCNSYERKIRSLIEDQRVKLIVENFADKNYPVVSAASILAKVARDSEIKKLTSFYGKIGSGYPSDKITIEFLKKCLRKNKEFPDIVRKRWKTVERLIEQTIKESDRLK